MGHYYSDIYSAHEIEIQRAKDKERRDQIAAKIKAAIEKEGIEYILTDILEDATMTHIKFMP